MINFSFHCIQSNGYSSVCEGAAADLPASGGWCDSHIRPGCHRDSSSPTISGWTSDYRGHAFSGPAHRTDHSPSLTSTEEPGNRPGTARTSPAHSDSICHSWDFRAHLHSPAVRIHHSTSLSQLQVRVHETFYLNLRMNDMLRKKTYYSCSSNCRAWRYQLQGHEFDSQKDVYLECNAGPRWIKHLSNINTPLFLHFSFL